MLGTRLPPVASDQTLRDLQILEGLELVRALALRMARRLPDNIDVDELMGEGTLGLIDAVDRFEQHRDIPFRHYAVIRIEGAMRDSLRRDDWVPRCVRRTQIDLERGERELTGRLGRPPTPAELAGCLGLSASDLAARRARARRLRLVSVDTPLSDEDGGCVGDLLSTDSPTAEEALSETEIAQIALEEIERLPEKERVVVLGYHIEGRTLNQLGKAMGLTESRVSQLRKAGEQRMLARISPRLR